MKISIPAKKKGFAPVAMADIAFLLLIFLIVTVSIGDSPDVKLPVFKYSRETGFPHTVIISLGSNGQLTLDGSPISEKALTPAILGMENPGEIIVNIQADAETPYEKVDSLLQTLGAAHLRKVVLITGSAPDEN